jgi:hypothetical protein
LIKTHHRADLTSQAEIHELISPDFLIKFPITPHFEFLKTSPTPDYLEKFSMEPPSQKKKNLGRLAHCGGTRLHATHSQKSVP